MKSFVYILVPLPKDKYKSCWFCDGTGKIVCGNICPRPGCCDGIIKSELTQIERKYVTEEDGVWYYSPHVPEALDGMREVK
jgi:hypothetical protein